MSHPGDEADVTLPPLGPRTPRNLFRWLMAWSRVHDISAAIIGGLIVGYILGKIL